MSPRSTATTAIVLCATASAMRFGALPPHRRPPREVDARGAASLPAFVCDDNDDALHTLVYENRTLLRCEWARDDLDVARRYHVFAALTAWYREVGNGTLCAELEDPEDQMAWLALMFR